MEIVRTPLLCRGVPCYVSAHKSPILRQNQAMGFATSRHIQYFAQCSDNIEDLKNIVVYTGDQT